MNKEKISQNAQAEEIDETEKKMVAEPLTQEQLNKIKVENEKRIKSLADRIKALESSLVLVDTGTQTYVGTPRKKLTVGTPGELMNAFVVTRTEEGISMSNHGYDPSGPVRSIEVLPVAIIRLNSQSKIMVQFVVSQYIELETKLHINFQQRMAQAKAEAERRKVEEMGQAAADRSGASPLILAPPQGRTGLVTPDGHPID